ncbi:hypothetical protein GZH53_02525 [Flavihumibacter sp. R14]|nr:hypothetical protein [Flavihumibacter soli]
MIPDNNSKHSERKHVHQDPETLPQDVNNIGTVGFVSYKDKEGKGSFKKIGKLKSIGPNEEGIGENEEDHSTRL